MFNLNMSIFNNISKYGLLAKLIHWLTAAGLLIQIPLGFYLVDLYRKLSYIIWINPILHNSNKANF